MQASVTCTAIRALATGKRKLDQIPKIQFASNPSHNDSVRKTMFGTQEVNQSLVKLSCTLPILSLVIKIKEVNEAFPTSRTHC